MRIIDKRNPYFSADPKLVVWRMDPVTMDFTEVAGNVEQLMGFPRSAWFESGFWVDRIHEEDREEALTFCASRTAAGRDHELEYRVVRADGEVIWIHDLVEVDTTGDDVNVHGFLLDITQRVNQERDVAHALNLHDEFMRFLSHDFTAPLKAMSGYGELLERHLAQRGDAVGSDYALAVRESIERLARLSGEAEQRARHVQMSYDDLVRVLRDAPDRDA